MNFITDTIDEIVEQQFLCVFLIDATGSMVEEKLLESINIGLQEFKNTIVADSYGITPYKVQVSVVAFDKESHVVLPPTSISVADIPILSANGRSSLQEAICLSGRVIDEQKSLYKKKGIPYYRPTIYCISDYNGFEEDEFQKILSSLEEDIGKKKYSFIPVAVGEDYDAQIVTRLSNHGIGFSVSHNSIIAFFRMIALEIIERSTRNVNIGENMISIRENNGIKIL